MYLSVSLARLILRMHECATHGGNRDGRPLGALSLLGCLRPPLLLMFLPHLRFPSSDTHGPVPSDSFLAGSSPVRACLPSFLPDCPLPPRPPLLSQTFLFLSSFSASTKVPLLLLSTRGYSTAVVSVVLVPAEAFGVSVGFMPYNTLMEPPRDSHS